MHATEYLTNTSVDSPANPAETTCMICRRPIDPAFDSVAHNADGFACHVTCRVKAVGGPQPYGTNIPLEVAIWLVSWPVGLARMIARWRGWSVHKATWISVALVAVAIVCFVAVSMAAETTPKVGSLTESIQPEVASYYTKLSPLGTTVDVTKAVCGDAVVGGAKCSIDLAITQDGTSQEGHVDVSVTEYQKDGTYRWMPMGVSGPAFGD